MKSAEQLLQMIGGTKEDDTQEVEQTRKPQVELIRSFNTQDLKRIVEEPQFLRDSFSDFYHDSDLPESKFVQFVLSKILESIKFCDWSALPSFYL